MIAGRHLDEHPEHKPVVLIVTDGGLTRVPDARREAVVRLAAGTVDPRVDAGRGELGD